MFALRRLSSAVTDQPYEDAARELVWTPLGAVAPRVGGTLAEDRRPGEVAYHFPGTGASVFDSRPGTLRGAYGGLFDLALMESSGGWITSAVDLARFGAAVDGSPTRPDLVSAATRAAMRTDHSGIGVYGYGWILAASAFLHTGALEGSNSILSVREDGLVVALLFNGNISIPIGRFVDVVAAVDDWTTEDLFDRYAAAATAH